MPLINKYQQKKITINYLKQKLNKLGKKKFLFITGKKSFKKSGAKFFFEPLIKNKDYSFFYKVKSYPDISELKSLILQIKKYNPNLIFAVGGGTVMDLSKIANFLCYSQNVKSDILNSNYNYKRVFCNLIAIPTTAGSGAEVTSNAVIYINKKKFSVESNFIKPNNFCLIPDFIKKNNFKLKSASGFDAIAQGVESIFSMKSNLISYKYAVDSLKLSLKNYLPYLKQPNTINSKKMLEAANLAGKAINISKTTAPHALSYPFTSYFGISHGHAVAITFNEFLKFNYLNKKTAKSNFNINDRFKVLFKLTQTQNINELEKYFIELEKNAKINVNFNDLGINIHKNIGLILKNVNIQRLSNNPIPLDYRTIKKLLLQKR
jgi:alcohol dehydrogenase class IV